ncbi:flagellar basal body P-ring formation chaperone FlgA [Rhodobacter sp. NSM]|uniref:flagellar basal body P-ring formation chaperone FlgA n=1 Tax=Rhodobacter sp. NSM TaxID=3457501 RepID=UPI003FD355B6
MRALCFLLCLVTPVSAETIVAARNIRALEVLEPGDVALQAEAVPGALTEISQALGQEARVTLYAGRPIRPGDVGPPAIIARNQIVQITFEAGALAIRAEGRALARGGVGDVIRVMNLSSRSTVTGRIADDGSVHVGPGS